MLINCANKELAITEFVYRVKGYTEEEIRTGVKVTECKPIEINYDDYVNYL